MEIIRVQEMLKKMVEKTAEGSFLPFSITFVTCSLKRNEGGGKITLDRAVYAGIPNAKSENVSDNFSRNIRHADGDRLFKIRPHLVTNFNGMQVAQ